MPSNPLSGLAKSEQRLQAIQHLTSKPDLSPEDRALLKNLQRSQQAAVKLRMKALDHQPTGHQTANQSSEPLPENPVTPPENNTPAPGQLDQNPTL